MAMDPIAQCSSTTSGVLQYACNPSTSKDDRTLYVSPAPLRRLMKIDSNLKEDATYVNTEEESPYFEISKNQQCCQCSNNYVQA